MGPNPILKDAQRIDPTAYVSLFILKPFVCHPGLQWSIFARLATENLSEVSIQRYIANCFLLLLRFADRDAQRNKISLLHLTIQNYAWMKEIVKQV